MKGGSNERRAGRSDAADIRQALDALRRVVQALRVAAPRTGLSSAQLFALQQIAEHPASSINDVAALTYTHQSSVSVVVRRLVDRGLVAKVAATADRRRQSLALTAKGNRALSRAPAPVQQRLIAAIAQLSRAERRQLASALDTVARAVAPDTLPAHPAMLFEDDGRRSRSRRAPALSEGRARRGHGRVDRRL
jgi:DNA-binding MarR family transcriptional regulator